MSRNEVTGWTQEQVEEQREKHRGDNFEKAYCLAEIPHQPDDYDGPTRYCGNPRTKEVGSSYRCKFHGGAGHGNPQNLDKLAPMTHGMAATQDHLRESFDDKDRALYEWVIGEFSKAYDIDVESNPNDAYDMHRLAVEIVRAERGRGHLIEEGEVREKPVKDEDGHIVTDENGEVVTEKSEHYLTKMMSRQDSKINDLEKQLGITRKERLRRTDEEAARDVIKGFAQLGDVFIGRDEKDYDPEAEPWAGDPEEVTNEDDG